VIAAPYFNILCIILANIWYKRVDGFVLQAPVASDICMYFKILIFVVATNAFYSRVCLSTYFIKNLLS
jgi:hypothetical protein